MQRFAYFRWDLLEEDDFGDAEVVVFCATRGGCDGESDFGERGIAVVVGDMHDFCGIGETLPGEAVGRGGAERLGTLIIVGDHLFGQGFVILVEKGVVVVAGGVVDHHGGHAAVVAPGGSILAVAVVEEDGLDLGGLLETDGDVEGVALSGAEDGGGTKIHVREVGGGVFGVGAAHLNGVARGGNTMIKEVGEACGLVFKPVVEA